MEIFNPELGMSVLILGGGIAVFIGSLILYQNKKYSIGDKKKRKK